MTVVKVVELVGQSKEGWEEAVAEAVREAAKTIRHISGVESTELDGRRGREW